MLDSARLTAFAATTAPDRARTFYGDTLGLRLLSEDSFALVFDCGGVHLRIQKLADLTPQTFTVLGWNVPDIRKAVGDLSGRGVLFQRYPSLKQDDLGVWQAPSGARVAWFKDPDGNVLSVTQGGVVQVAARTDGARVS